MQHAEQLNVARRLLNLIDTQGTDRSEAPYLQPVSEYIDLGVAAREQEVFFRRQPLCLGLSNDLPDTGTYRVHDLAGVPILLVRDLEGRFRAFLNVCRHRGARLAEACGAARGFTCPYHAWVFSLDGSLVNRPDEASFAALAREDFGLTRLAAEEQHGMLWVCPTPGQSMDIAAWLGNLGPELGSYGLGTFSHYASREITRRMNWKLVIDTFLESYHFCVLHRDSICSTFFQNLGLFDAYGQHFRLVSPRKSITTATAPAADDSWSVLPHTVIIYILFPNTVVVWQGEQIELWQIFPGSSPDEAVMRLSLYSPTPALTEKARRHWDRNLEVVLNVVQNEDFPLGEGIQQGFHSAAQSHTVFGRNEPALAHYHREMTRALAG
ncbi:MAG: Rieske 2Fe-2S domain-containing protein [Gammaproteobacteria bacterium]|nr:Rieske 2Fe-2S domain-containing protein [Gammaproteobacteria bacterium]